MNTSIELLPLAAAICLFVALIQAWFMTMIRYLKMEGIKKLFPGYRDLVRSHIDFLMMAALIFSLYLVILKLNIELPNFICWLIAIGAIYNPLGFLFQAIKPSIAEGEGLLFKLGLIAGFLPLTIGLVYSSLVIIIKITANLLA